MVTEQTAWTLSGVITLGVLVLGALVVHVVEKIWRGKE